MLTIKKVGSVLDFDCQKLTLLIIVSCYANHSTGDLLQGELDYVDEHLLHSGLIAKKELG